MGIFCILLGIFAFFAFTAGGAILARTISNIITRLAGTFVTMQSASSSTISIILIAAFALIGLLVGMSLIMHGLTFRSKARYGQKSVSYICFSIGAIALCSAILSGFFASKAIIENKDLLALFGFIRSTPDILIYSVITGVFAFIGLIVFVSITMQGMTYNKVSRMQSQLRKRG